MKKVKPTPPSKQFRFWCEEERRAYQVSESTAREFLTKKLRKKLDESLKDKVTLQFSNGCPMCKPDNTYKIELSVSKQRIN